MNDMMNGEGLCCADLKDPKFNSLRALLQQCLMEHFSAAHQRFAGWAALDRSLKALKKRGKQATTARTGGVDQGHEAHTSGFAGKNQRLDETQRGLNYIDDINIPLGYFVLDTLEAQMDDIFFQRDEVWQFGAVNPDEAPLAKKFGAKIRAAGNLFGHQTELKTTLHCALKYNEGWTVPSWRTHYQTEYGVHLDAKSGKRAKTTRDVLRMEGCALSNISPYRMIRDPLCAPDKPEDMRFLGSWKPISKLDLARKYKIDPDILSAVDWMWPATLSTGLRDGYAGLFSTANMGNYMTIVADLYIDLVPSEHGLSPSDSPEVWHFAMAGYDQLLRGRKADIPNGKYPYRSLVPNGDGADTNPVGIMELIKDMIAMYNWLHAVRMAAVRNDISGDYLINERLVNVDDLKQRDPYRGGNVIRLARTAWMMPNAMQQAITRLAFTHDTKDYSRDAEALFANIKIISSIVDPISGIGDNPSSRRTAEEINRVVANASKRIKKLAGRVHDTWLRPLGVDVALYTQANSEATVKVQDSAGAWEEVNWYDLMIPVEATVGDGYIMKDPSALAGSWQTLFGIIQQNPGMLGMFKVVKMMEAMGDALGIPNLGDFISPEGVAAANAAIQMQNGAGGAQPGAPAAAAA